MRLKPRPFCAALAGICLLWAGPAEAATDFATGAFVGSVGCKSSSCHGGAGEKRSQYLTWSQQDFHTRAYPVLVNARSARMAETLGLNSAQTSARCTVCHAPFQTVDSSRLNSAIKVEEGVSCESCHNAAGGWLRGHTRPDWTYAMRVSAGMRDLRNFYVRANSCVACHQNVDADILAAGHPVLHFELDGQSVAEPKHWRDEPATATKAWLVGQAVALREVSWTLANTQKPSPDLIPQWNGLLWVLSKVTGQQSMLPALDASGVISSNAEFIEIQQRADALARAASGASFDADFTRNALLALAATDSEFSQGKEPRDLLFGRAQRLVMGLHRLAIASGVYSEASPSPQYQELLEASKGVDSFDPGRFGKALVKYRDALNGTAPGER